MTSIAHSKCFVERFYSSGQQQLTAMPILIGAKQSVYVKKNLSQSLLQDWFGIPTWPPYFYLEHQYGYRDVMLKRSITSQCVSTNQLKQNRLYT